MLQVLRVGLCASLLATAMVVAAQEPGHTATPPKVSTVVSLTFDDGSASQYAVGRRLKRHGMVGTFYVNSGKIGSSPYYMTWREVHRLARTGHEIGGHTLHDNKLTTMSAATAMHEVCGDRRRMLRRGFSPMASFAYPDGASNASLENTVASCGYRSGRGVGNINSISNCVHCPYAETIPPRDTYELRTPQAVTSSTTLSDLKTYVTNAERHGGGWVNLEFFGVCDNNCTLQHSVRTATFRRFLNWLQPRASQGTVVRTVGQVIGR